MSLLRIGSGLAFRGSGLVGPDCIDQCCFGGGGPTEPADCSVVCACEGTFAISATLQIVEQIPPTNCIVNTFGEWFASFSVTQGGPTSGCCVTLNSAQALYIRQDGCIPDNSCECEGPVENFSAPPCNMDAGFGGPFWVLCSQPLGWPDHDDFVYQLWIDSIASFAPDVAVLIQSGDLVPPLIFLQVGGIIPLTICGSVSCTNVALPLFYAQGVSGGCLTGLSWNLSSGIQDPGVISYTGTCFVA